MGKLGKMRDKKRAKINEYKKIFIFCEGKTTEPIYFNDFKKELEQQIRRKEFAIVVEGKGYNTLSLVKYVEDELSKLSKEKFDKNIDEVWLVFDEDTKKHGDFDNAIKKALSCNFKVAYSNECFEIWYLLHFSLYNTNNGRDEYYKKLPGLLKKLDKSLKITNWRKEGKNLKGIYGLLKNQQDQAIKNAKDLIKQYHNKKIPFSKQKPSTTVHLLVEALNKLRS